MTDMRTDIDAFKEAFTLKVKEAAEPDFSVCFYDTLTEIEVYIRDYKIVKNEMERTFNKLTQKQEKEPPKKSYSR